MSRSGRVEAAAERSELVRRALETSRDLHAGAVCDVGDEVPFIEHPLAVAELLAEYDLGDELVAAGLLHDALEHTDLGLGSLRERFGMKIAMIVCALSEDFEIEDYEERKRELRDRVAATGIEAQRVFAADKIANVVATRDHYVLVQEDVASASWSTSTPRSLPGSSTWKCSSRGTNTSRCSSSFRRS